MHNSARTKEIIWNRRIEHDVIQIVVQSIKWSMRMSSSVDKFMWGCVLFVLPPACRWGCLYWWWADDEGGGWSKKVAKSVCLQRWPYVPLPPSHRPCSSMLSTRPQCAWDVWWRLTISEVSRQLYGVMRSNKYGHVAVEKGNLTVHGLDSSG
jgi:hypothetical protein